jgi:hypothetical protein
MGIDIGKNSLHVVGLDARGAIALRQKWLRGQVASRLASMAPCLIGMEACVGAHHLSRKLKALGHDARLMPAKYVRPYSKGQKNDFRDAEAIAEALQHLLANIDGEVVVPDEHGRPNFHWLQDDLAEGRTVLRDFDKGGYYLIWRHCHYLPVHFGQPQWSETFVNSGLYELERIPLERVG